jgi:hypothetical protein
MEPLKQVAIATAHRHSVLVSVFDAGERIPELATGSLIAYAEGPVLVTAAHVLHRHLDLANAGRLQIGTNRFTLHSLPKHLIHFSETHDIAAVLLDEDDLPEIGKEPFSFSELAASPVKENDLVAFVGYPGQWKDLSRSPTIFIGSYEFFGPVRTVEDDQFSILVEPWYEFRTTTTRPNFVPGEAKALGGLSGAPIFSATRPPHLVGWIYEGALWSPGDHKLYAVHANAVTQLCSWIS